MQRKVVNDERGKFGRFFCHDSLEAWSREAVMKQANFSHTNEKGCVRGLHFQHPPKTEKKIVTCIRGSVWDVVVDVRFGSPTFLTSFAIELSDKNSLSLLIPEGFAHGFQTLESHCTLLYTHSVEYDAALESGLNVFDPVLKIEWPLPVTRLSAKDKAYSFLSSEFKGIQIDEMS